MAKKVDHKADMVVFFIPAGLLIGLGVGLLFDRPDAGVLVGLGGGFFMWAIGGMFSSSR